MTDAPQQSDPFLPPFPDDDAESRIQMAPAMPAVARETTVATPKTVDRPELHLLDYVRILYKRRYMALTVFALVVLVVSVYTFTAVPLYTARTRILIDVENPNVVSFKEVINEQQAKTDYNQTQYNILQSRSLARKTVESMKLGDQLLASSTRTSKVSVTGVLRGVVGWIGGLFGGEASPPAQSENQIPAADETAAQSREIDAFLSHLSVSPLRGSRLVDVSYTLPDPALATQIVNALAKNYIQQNLEYKFLASQDASDFLNTQLQQQRKNVETAEAALQKYREQNDAISLADRENITVQKLTELNAAVTRAKTERIGKEALYNQLRTADNASVLDTYPAIMANGFVQQLKAQLADLQRQQVQLSEKFGPLHPEMQKITSAIQNTQAKLDAEIRKVVQSVKSEYENALAQEQSLSSALNQQKSEALAMNRKSIEYSVLDRDVQSSKQLYDNLMQRSKETGVAGELKSSNIRVIDIAEQPRAPVSPNRMFNETAAIFGGSLLAIVLAFFVEYLDNRIKSPEEIKAHLGLPHLGMLPLVDESAKSGKYVLLDGETSPNFAEAFRVVRTNVLFSSAAAGGQSVLITSTSPGEGKSMVASNLALSLAQAGRRVILLDADLRKPKVHQAFGVPQEPGLSNVLVGNAKASESVRKGSVPGLWVLPAGRIPPNPAELLGSQRFHEFIGSLRQHFDWIVIDSPPVMAVADASVLANLATGVVFVIGSEMTSRHIARRAIEQLHNSQAKFFGAVLNRVDLQRNAYYYSQYYRREYSTYYTSKT